MPWWRNCRAGVVGLVMAAGLVAAVAPSAARQGRAASSQTVPVHLYWSEPETSRGPSGSGINTIWRANVSGTSVERNFIGGLQIPGAVAVGGSHIYWSDDEAGMIGRARIDGTHVRRSLIKSTADALALTATHVYWTTGSFPGRQAAVWRANLDGSHVHKVMAIGTGTYIGGLAIAGSHIYWTNRDRGTIGRATLNGTQVRRRFIVGLADPTGLAATGHDLYWAATVPGSSDSIGRAVLAPSGPHVNQNFITGAAYPYGVAVGGGHLYWANYNGGTIGRADLDGSNVNQDFISAQVPYSGSNAAAPQALALGP